MIIYICVILGWVIYSSIFGYTDAWYWYSANMGKYGLNNFKFKDLHPHFFWSRSLVGSIFSYSICQSNLIIWFFIMISFGLIFPFFHNGLYYYTRNKIDSNKYPLGFMDMSSTSIAKINFTFSVRSIMLSIGLLSLFFIYILR